MFCFDSRGVEISPREVPATEFQGLLIYSAGSVFCSRGFYDQSVWIKSCYARFLRSAGRVSRSKLQLKVGLSSEFNVCLGLYGFTRESEAEPPSSLVLYILLVIVILNTDFYGMTTCQDLLLSFSCYQHRWRHSNPPHSHGPFFIAPPLAPPGHRMASRHGC